MAVDEVGQGDAEFNKKVGDLVRRLRVERGWTQEDLADESRMHVNHVGFIERSERMPTVGALRRIARALGMRLSELLGMIGE